MKSKGLFGVALFCGTALGCAALLTIAGPLDPPPGAVSSSLKTLAEVEPRTAINPTNTPGDANSVFKITKPGSYYLLAPVDGASGKHGIEIAADNVSIDLNGFSVQGVPGSLNGITSDGFSDNLTIRNGVVIGWGGAGIELAATGLSIGFLVEDIHAISNGARGISVATDSVVRGCRATFNAQEGIRVRAVSGSVGDGVVVSCVASSNTGVGILVGAGSTITDCVAVSNSGGGFATSSGCIVSACAARTNGGTAIAVGSGSTDSGCIAQGTGLGTSSGISVVGTALVIDNQCTSNGSAAGGAGILVAGTASRIERNNCAGNGTGVLVNGSGNVVIATTCSGNTNNWSIAANNYYGPILNRVGIATAAATGNTAPGTMASTDPHANFSY